MIEPEKSFLELQKTAQCDVPGVEFAGFSCTSFLPESGELFNAVIMILDDSNVDEIKGTLVEEIYQSLGVPNDHDKFRNSINYEDEHGASLLTELGMIDKKTLVFLYKYLEPGDDEAMVKEKFDKHWASILID